MLILIWILTTITVCTSSQSWVVHPSTWKYFQQAHDRMKRGVKSKEHMCADAPNKNLCLPKSYSKFELPFTESVNVVEIGIDIIDVLRINDKEYSVTFSSYFNVLWQEPRLHISERFLRELNATSPDTMIPVNLELVNELWLPNIFIYNLKTFKVVEVLSKHAGLWITTNNDVFYSQATHITFICPMRFDSFPLDTQRCLFQVGSYSFNDQKMIFLESPRVKGYVETSRSIVLDYDVKINPLKLSDRILNYGSLGNYSLAGFEMILHRYVSHYIITYYLPSGLFVVVSWISFVVPPDVIPGRMALLITLFLVLVNIFNSVTTNTPKAEGLTAIEAWMLACILFVFGALVEYAVILFRRQTSKDNVDRPTEPTSSTHHQRVRIICKDNFKYEVAPPSNTQTPNVNAGQHEMRPLSETVASVTNAGTNHHLLHHRGGGTLAPHHPHHPHHVQAAAVAAHHHAHSHINFGPMNPEPLAPVEDPDLIKQQEEKWDFCGENYINVDRFFLVAMPLLFLVFNIVYWFAYGSHFILNSMKDEDDESFE